MTIIFNSNFISFNPKKLRKNSSFRYSANDPENSDKS